MSGRTYLDWNASAPLRPEALEAACAALALTGNPSSVHAEGRAARAAIERARAQVAALVGCAAEEVIFTSGATEAAGLLARLPGAVTVQPTAHDCLWAHRRGGGDAATLAMGLANSETGAVTPPARDADGWIAPDGGRAARLLLDITQAVGRIPFDFAASGADFAVLSAHKLGGPKGAGALVVRGGVEHPALALGGGQEGRRRAGTEGLAAIAGFGAAAEAAACDLRDGAWDPAAQLRDRLEARLSEADPGLIWFGADGPRLPNTSLFAAPGWRGETQVMQMDISGFAVSAGAACTSGKVGPSRVLRALGADAATAESALRVSIGPTTTEAEADAFADAWIGWRRRRDRRAA